MSIQPTIQDLSKGEQKSIVDSLIQRGFRPDHYEADWHRLHLLPVEFANKTRSREVKAFIHTILPLAADPEVRAELIKHGRRIVKDRDARGRQGRSREQSPAMSRSRAPERPPKSRGHFRGGSPPKYRNSSFHRDLITFEPIGEPRFRGKYHKKLPKTPERPKEGGKGGSKGRSQLSERSTVDANKIAHKAGYSLEEVGESTSPAPTGKSGVIRPTRAAPAVPVPKREPTNPFKSFVGTNNT